ncbi:MAG TPA: ATP-binding protein [Chitinophagaceae bacterium]|jgi:hypothetical protein|nr:ATP-binding protein [Chitinophagaceae bacterium]
MIRIIGRQKELQLLREVATAPASAFVAVYGRRRVGKTFLIREAFQQQFCFSLTGVANISTAQQLANFHHAFVKYQPAAEGSAPPSGWLEAFQRLIGLVERSPEGKKVLFLDELPWLDTAQSGFIPALEHFWNSWASARTDIVLVVCGSAAAWMIQELLGHTGGLHNRVTHRLRLRPFTLQECEAFLQAKGGQFDRYQLMLLYMALGGIPFYLEQVRTGDSAAQNINRLCFEADGALRTEFDILYRSLFKKAAKHVALIEALSKKAKGLTRRELLGLTGLPDAGSTTRIIRELEESDFIRRYAPYGQKERNALYQLVDPYSLFYLKWIRRSSVLDEHTWINQLDSPAQRAWSGYAFEQACLAHIPQIKKALGISGVQTMTSSWVSTGLEKGAQIDLVIDRRDGVINICEMKFSLHSFTIDKKYAEELKNKLRAFREETGTRKALYLTMITTFGVTANAYRTDVQKELTMDVLFESA